MAEIDRVKNLYAYRPSPTAKDKEESKELEAIKIFKKLKSSISKNPTEGAIVEAKGIMKSHEDALRNKSSAAISSEQHAEFMYAKAVLANAKANAKPITTKKNKGGPVNKRPQIMKGGAYKGKKHSYAAGGKVNKLDF